MFTLITIGVLSCIAAAGSTVLYRKARALEDENAYLKSQLSWSKSVHDKKESEEEEE